MSQDIGVIWIGGLFLGGILIYNAFDQWADIRKLDNANREPYVNIFAQFDHRRNLKEDDRHAIIKCGQCYQKFAVPKGQGLTKVKCPGCSKEFKIRT